MSTTPKASAKGTEGDLAGRQRASLSRKVPEACGIDEEGGPPADSHLQTRPQRAVTGERRGTAGRKPHTSLGADVDLGRVKNLDASAEAQIADARARRVTALVRNDGQIRRGEDALQDRIRRAGVDEELGRNDVAAVAFEQGPVSKRAEQLRVELPMPRHAGIGRNKKPVPSRRGLQGLERELGRPVSRNGRRGDEGSTQTGSHPETPPETREDRRSRGHLDRTIRAAVGTGRNQIAKRFIRGTPSARTREALVTRGFHGPSTRVRGSDCLPPRARHSTMPSKRRFLPSRRPFGRPSPTLGPSTRRRPERLRLRTSRRAP